MGQSPIRVLYVDDDWALVRLVQKTLARQNFEIMHAANADDALGAIGSGEIDVVALDHYLPTGTGLDLLMRLAALPSAPPSAQLTSKPRRASARDASRRMPGSSSI